MANRYVSDQKQQIELGGGTRATGLLIKLGLVHARRASLTMFLICINK